jgi:hypothetical protein
MKAPKLLSKLLIVAPLVALGGCAVEARPAYPAAPGLVYAGPGVSLVAGTDDVYYADDYYWFYDGGLWYQSAFWGGPRVAVGFVPRFAAGIRVHPYVGGIRFGGRFGGGARVGVRGGFRGGGRR